MVMKDRYTLIERSDTLLNSAVISYLVNSLQGFNFITFYYFKACISKASVSSENNFGMIG